MSATANNLKPLFKDLISGISDKDLTDISGFIKEEVLGSRPSAGLRKKVGAFISIRLHYWQYRRGKIDGPASAADVELALEEAVSAGAPRARMIDLATKLSRALDRMEE